MSKKKTGRQPVSKKFPGIVPYVKRDGSKTWEPRAYDSATQSTIGLGTFASPEEAREARNEFLRTSSKRVRSRDRTLIVDFAKGWPESHRGRRKDSTLRSHRYAMRPFVDAFGVLRFRDLDPMAVSDWASTQRMWAISGARAMLTDAKRSGYLKENPLRDIPLPVEPGRSDRPALSTAEVLGLIEISKDLFKPGVGAQVAGTIASAIYLGVRIGEACAVRGQRVNRSAMTVSIDAQVDVGQRLRSPKRGPRVSALSELLLEKWTDLGADFGSGPLFGPPTTEYFTKTNFYNYWCRIVDASGIPGLEFHEIRHHCITWLFFLGAPPFAIGRHVGIEMENSTIRRYTHDKPFALDHIRKVLVKGAEGLPDQGRSTFVPSDAEDSQLLKRPR